MKRVRVWLAVVCIAGAMGLGASFSAGAEPIYEGELIFPLESWHNHGSCIVECPNGDLLVCWFHGSGERKEDDVEIRGARLVKKTGKWSAPFVMGDVPGFPDTNCCMIIDPKDRLWLFWPTILAHTWESALMHYRVSSNYMEPEGPPVWDNNEILFMKPGADFEEVLRTKTEAYVAEMGVSMEGRIKEWAEHNYGQASDELTRRLGWFTRAHPYILPDGRMLVGLYSDGFSISLVAYTDDWGDSWQFSEPIVGGGNIQPSFAMSPDGSLTTYMRDNGPAPKRVMVSHSKDRGETWSTVYDHPQLANPGAGLEVATLSSGEWVCIYNDLEQGRHSLAVSLSTDQGKTWPVTRHLELSEAGTGSYHYPSIIEGRDGSLHASYSYFVNGEREGKSIKYAHFTLDWVRQGDQE